MIDFSELFERCSTLGVDPSQVLTVPMRLRYASPIPGMDGLLHLCEQTPDDTDELPIPCGTASFEDPGHPHHGPVSAQELAELLVRERFCTGCLTKFDRIDLSALADAEMTFGPMLELTGRAQYVTGALETGEDVDPLLLAALFSGQQQVHRDLDAADTGGYSDEKQTRIREQRDRLDKTFDALADQLAQHTTASTELTELLEAYTKDRLLRS